MATGRSVLDGGLMRRSGGTASTQVQSQDQSQSGSGYGTGIGDGYFSGLDPNNMFGPSTKDGPRYDSPFYGVGAGDNRKGAGLYGLPPAFAGWSAPARYSFAPSLQFAEGAQQAADFYGGEMNKDYSKDLFSKSSDVYEAQARGARRKGEQGLARSGYSGTGGTSSPFASLQVQQEGMARAGALGSAARESVLNAQQIRSEAGRNYLNTLSQQLQALLVPAHLQAAAKGKVPTGGVGPNLIPSAMNAGAAFLNAAV